jgi:DHA1 family multidrug resistance protein-like MFS transporter
MTPTVLTLLVAQFVTFVGVSFVFPLLPLYVAELGVTDPGQVAAWSGFLGALTPLCSGIFMPFWSHHAERIGLRPLILWTMLAYAVIIGAMGFVGSVWQLAALRAMYGIMGGLSAIVAGALSKLVPEEKIGRTLGLMQTVSSVAFAMGPFLGGVTKDAFGYKATFGVVAALCLLGALLVAIGFREPAKAASAPKPKTTGRERFQRAIALVGPMMILMAVAQLAVNSFEVLLPLAVQRYPSAAGATASWAGAALSVIGLGTIASSLLLGWLSDRFGSAKILAVAFGGGIVSAAGLAMSGNPGNLTLWCGIWGLFTGGIPAVAYALGASRVAADERVAIIGWIGSASAFGIAAGPLVGGLLASFGLEAVFGFSAALCLLGAATAWLSTAPRPVARPTPEPNGV